MNQNMAQPLPQNILTSLTIVFKGRPSEHARVLMFLTNCQAQRIAAPYLQSLQSVIDDPDVFRLVAERLAEDTNESDEVYQRQMRLVWSLFLEEKVSDHPDDGKKWHFAAPTDSLIAVVPFNVQTMMQALQAEKVTELLGFISKICMDERLMKMVSSAVRYYEVNPALGNVALAGVALSASCCRIIKRWWKGEISGKRCLKKVIDCIISTSVSMAIGKAGQAIGEEIGACFGPTGIAVGVVAGGIFATGASVIFSHAFSDRLSQNIFDLPQNEALENAYKLIGVSCTASNSIINSSFHARAMEYIKTDSKNDLDLLQIAMAIVTEARS